MKIVLNFVIVDVTFICHVHFDLPSLLETKLFTTRLPPFGFPLSRQKPIDPPPFHPFPVSCYTTLSLRYILY